MAGAISPSIGSLAAVSCGRRSPACSISRIVRRTSTLVSHPIARSAVRVQLQSRRRWYTYTWRAVEQPLCCGRSLGSDHGAAVVLGQRGMSIEAMESPPPPSSSLSSMARGLVGARGKEGGGRQSALGGLSRSRLEAISRDDVDTTNGVFCGDASPVGRDRDMQTTTTTTTTAVGRRQWTAVVAATLAAAAAAATTATSFADVALADDCSSTTFIESPLGLSFCDIKVGDGDAPQKGMLIKAHYTGRLASTGGVFDSSYNRGKPLVFRVGVGEVIKGWDVGILGTDGIPAMLPGGKRTLLIPPGLGYGERGAGCRGVTPDTCVIPPNSTLIFDVDYIGKA